MTQYTVKQLAAASGVSVRTLHHYDEIGLLKPARVSGNGYRYYGTAELLRLQQILLHRELGIALQDIAALLDRPGMSRIAALRAQRERLLAQAERYTQLIATIDRTLALLATNPQPDRLTMRPKELYRGLSAQQQAGYETWLVDRYGADMRQVIDASNAHLAGQGKEGLRQQLEELAQVEAGLVECCRNGLPADSPQLQPWLARHRHWIAGMWNRPCTAAAYAGLAGLYLAHPDFRARYETLQAGFAEYLAAAMRAYAARLPG